MKIPCYVLVYDQIEIINKSLDSLSYHSNILEIVVIENRSINTFKISHYINHLMKKGIVARYYQFNDNISNNAYEVVLEKEIRKITRSKYVIVTDGDLIARSQNWLYEQLKILKNNNDVFACGISLDMSNLPIKTFPQAKEWIPQIISEHPDYYENNTGCHLLLMRGRELAKFMSWRRKKKLPFLDQHIHTYCYEILNKKWVRTKKAKARHLTWDLYNNLSHEYTRRKISKTKAELWAHNNYSDFELFYGSQNLSKTLKKD